MSQPMTYGFLGLGLIGGSIARAIKKFQPTSRIIAYTPHKETVDNAHAAGIVDVPVYQIGADFTECDFIFLCAPVELNNVNLELLLPYINERTTITDIGSVKNSIHDKVKELGFKEVTFTTKPSVMQIGYGLYKRMDFEEIKSEDDYVEMKKMIQ